MPTWSEFTSVAGLPRAQWRHRAAQLPPGRGAPAARPSQASLPTCVRLPRAVRAARRHPCVGAVLHRTHLAAALLRRRQARPLLPRRRQPSVRQSGSAAFATWSSGCSRRPCPAAGLPPCPRADGDCAQPVYRRAWIRLTTEKSHERIDRCPDRQAARRSEAGCRRCRLLLTTTAGEAGAGAEVAGPPAGGRRARATPGGRPANGAGQGRAAGRAADDYVHDNPWRSIGIAAGFGLVVGLLIGRR